MTARIATDADIVRQPTPKRYLTVLEALRGRCIAVLPRALFELDDHLPKPATKHVWKLASRRDEN